MQIQGSTNMYHLSSPQRSVKFSEKIVLLYFATVCCFHGATLSVVGASDIAQINPAKSMDDDPEINNQMSSKRAWSSNLNMWGKRGWNSLHPGWGKRDSDFETPENDLTNYSPEKRDWQGLQGGWGKRYIPSEDDLALKRIEAAMEESQRNDVKSDMDTGDLELFVPIESNLDDHHFDKRNWNKFTDGWGKRSDQNRWNKFKGSWGKREPAWNSLKGLWGKRSILK